MKVIGFSAGGVGREGNIDRMVKAILERSGHEVVDLIGGDDGDRVVQQVVFAHVIKRAGVVSDISEIPVLPARRTRSRPRMPSF